jgi:KDO2-lipid IV(A) lauroyltransferase
LILLLKAIAKLAVALPYRWALALGRGLGAFFALLAPVQRQRALRQLRECFPDKSESEIRTIAGRVFRNIGMNIVELLRWIGGADQDVKSRINLETEDYVNTARARGKGVLILTAHIGNWDLLGLWGAAQLPLTIISKDIKNKSLNQYWMEQRKKAGLKIVPAHGSYRDCLRLLRKNECLGFILDQNMTRMEGIFVEFFGRPACTTPGLAMLAAHAESPVVPVFMMRRDDGRYAVRILPPIDPPPDRNPETVQRATQEYTRIVEDVIREQPDQWIWMHRRWRTQPIAGVDMGRRTNE